MELCRRVGNRRGDGSAARWRKCTATVAATGGRSTAVPTALPRACSPPGLARHDKVALYLYNTPEYLETAFAVDEGRARSGQHELSLQARRAASTSGTTRMRRRSSSTARSPRPSTGCARDVTKVKLWLHVGAGLDSRRGPQATRRRPPRRPRTCAPPWGRSGDDPIFIYTGGTTGRPKGVMWRQHDLYMASNVTNDPPPADRGVRARAGGERQRIGR